MSKSFSDLVHQYERNRPAFSDFLGLAEISDFYLFLRDYPNLPYELYGGADNCERRMLKIGSEETLGYDLPFPITAIEIKPKNSKFTDNLTHRDFLGALMNLGIERDRLGDIIVKENSAYVFCEDSIAPFILQNLTRVKHTTVICSKTDSIPEQTSLDFSEKLIQVASKRLDLITAKIYNISRTASCELFETGRVFVNGRICQNNSYALKPGELVSVRGFGRFRLKEEKGLSKKGKYNLIVEHTK